MAASNAPEVSQWGSMDEFDNDILEFSEITNPRPYKVITPPTITNWYNRVSKIRKKSIFDDDTLDPNKSYFVSGRGRGGRNVTLIPGTPMESNPKDVEEIQQKLRRLSGFGYTNQFIENTIKSNSRKHLINSQKTETIFENDSTPSSSNLSSPNHKVLVSDSDDDQLKSVTNVNSQRRGNSNVLLQCIEKNMVPNENGENIAPLLLDNKNFPNLINSKSQTSGTSSSDMNVEGKSHRRCRGRGSNRRFAN